MLTVSIKDHDGKKKELSAEINISGNTIIARSCHNTGETNEQGEHKYCVDDGTIVWHDRSDGAAVLAQKILETVKCPEVSFGETHK